MATDAGGIEVVADAATTGGAVRATGYSYYALILLVLANLFNYLDRPILGPQMPGLNT